MNKHTGKLIRALVSVALLVGVQACMTSRADNDPNTAMMMQQGHYLAIASDCVACHTAVGGKPFAGGLPTQTPIGAVFSTNITPSKSDGIGNYTLQQFSDAVRKGIRADGAHLYPVMPYTEYAQLTDTDMQALYDWFMHGVPPVNSKPPQTQLPFPFNIRLSMLVWNFLFLDDKPFTPDPSKSPQWNRGAYLVRGPAHCGTCHTPRNLMMAEKSSAPLAGTSLGTWIAPNITSDVNSGIGSWSEQDIVAYLQSGHAPGKAQAAGPMIEAIDNSLRHLRPMDLQAIATYLKTVPPIHDAADTQPVSSWGKAYADLASLRGQSLPPNADAMTGSQLYDAYCSTCHQDQGQGSFDGGLPPLFHNSATGHIDTNNLVMVMLDGINWHTDGSGTHMPGFAHELSDQQIATLGNYLTQHFGNPSAKVTTTQVATLRAGGAPSHLVLLMWIAIAVILILAVILLLLVKRRCCKTKQHVD